MAIYQLFEEEKREGQSSEFYNSGKGKTSFFSTLMTRFCFFLLLLACAGWIVYSTLFFSFTLLGGLLTGFKSRFFRKSLSRSRLHFCRSTVCFLALFIGLICPPFGIMIACTYFLMYDKAGMEEVVPTTLQAQFKDIFSTHQ